MTRSSLYLLPLCLLLTFHSACGFVSRAPRAFSRVFECIPTQTVLASVLRDEHQDEKLLKHYGLTPSITTVKNMEDFLKFLGEDERLCVVKFHASWCKSCQKVGVKFRHLALDVTDVYDNGGELVSAGMVRMASVEFGANPQLCKSLGIKRLPFIHIYKGAAGRIAAFPCGPQKFPTLVEKLQHFLDLTDEELKFEKHMDEGGALGDQILTELQQVHYEQAETVLKKKSNTKSSTTDSVAP